MRKRLLDWLRPWLDPLVAEARRPLDWLVAKDTVHTDTTKVGLVLAALFVVAAIVVTVLTI